jgi:hypothetical protein
MKNLIESINYKKGSKNLSKLKIVSIGQEIYFRKTSFEGETTDFIGKFIPYTFFKDWEKQLTSLIDESPHIVLIYRPEVFEPKFLELLKSKFITIGYFTEPLPFDRFRGHPDLLSRYSFIKNFDFNLCDYYIFYNSVTTEVLNSMCKPILTHPLPVNDLVFEKRFELRTDFVRGLFLGRVSDYRNKYLMPLKHYWDWTVIDHGMNQIDFESNFNLALNLHSETYPNFENRIFHQMAQGLVILSQKMIPTLGLKHNKHFFEFDTPDDMLSMINSLSNNLDSILKVRDKGLEFVEEYKASRFWGTLIKKLETNLR